MGGKNTNLVQYKVFSIKIYFLIKISVYVYTHINVYHMGQITRWNNIFFLETGMFSSY